MKFPPAFDNKRELLLMRCLSIYILEYNKVYQDSISRDLISTRTFLFIYIASEKSFFFYIFLNSFFLS